MIAKVIALLKQHPLLEDCQFVEESELPDGTIILKVRCRVARHLTFQVRIKQSKRGLRYSYQLFSNHPLLRWDNAPHFAEIENFPHHHHNSDGKLKSSKLIGDPLQDLLNVLDEVDKFLDPKT